jgi:hypothetical protein
MQRRATRLSTLERTANIFPDDTIRTSPVCITERQSFVVPNAAYRDAGRSQRTGISESFCKMYRAPACSPLGAPASSRQDADTPSIRDNDGFIACAAGQ